MFPILSSGAGADEIYKSDWPLFETIKFIDNTTNRESNGNIKVLLSSIEPKKALAQMAEIKNASNAETVPSTPSPIISNECVTLEMSDRLFFQSMLPYVNQIKNKREKMLFRMDVSIEMLPYLEDEEEDEEEDGEYTFFY